MRMENKTIPAIHVRDIADVLQQYSQKADFENGMLKCTECSSVLTLENLGSMRKLGDKLVFTCNSIQCYLELINRQSDR